MAQVIHEWVLKTDPVMPTWNDVADLIQYIGHFNLANSLRQVYVTGMEAFFFLSKYSMSFRSLFNNTKLSLHTWHQELIHIEAPLSHEY